MNKKTIIIISTIIMSIGILFLALTMWPKNEKSGKKEKKTETITAEVMLGKYHGEKIFQNKKYVIDLELFVSDDGIYSSKIKSMVDDQVVEETVGQYSYDSKTVIFVRMEDTDYTKLPLGTNAVMFNIKDKNKLELTANYFIEYGLENEHFELKRMNK